MKLNELRDAAFKNSVNHGFYDGPVISVGEKIALMHTELSEAFEEYRSGRFLHEVYFSGGFTDEDGACYPSTKPEGVPIELADCIIRILDFCGAMEIDIEEAVRIKMAYNETRPYKHGKLL